MMAAIGLTWGQIALGTNVYDGVRALTPPALQKNRLQHVVASSVTFPTKDAGYLPGVLSGTLLLSETDVDDFIADVALGSTERRISWMLGAVEVYCYAFSGDTSSPNCRNPYGSFTRYYEVSFEFQLSRSAVYVASDDSVLYGG
jgi:hypothetical protein